MELEKRWMSFPETKVKGELAILAALILAHVAVNVLIDIIIKYGNKLMAFSWIRQGTNLEFVSDMLFLKTIVFLMFFALYLYEFFQFYLIFLEKEAKDKATEEYDFDVYMEYLLYEYIGEFPENLTKKAREFREQLRACIKEVLEGVKS